MVHDSSAEEGPLLRRGSNFTISNNVYTVLIDSRQPLICLRLY